MDQPKNVKLINLDLFWNSTTNNVASISPDGEFIAYSIQRQIVVERVGNPAGVRFWNAESLGNISEIHWGPDSNQIVLVADPSGLELTQLHVIDLSETTIRRMTRLEDKNEFILFESSGSVVFRRAVARSPFFDIFKLDTSTGMSELAYENISFPELLTDSEGLPRIGKIVETDGKVRYLELPGRIALRSLGASADDSSAIRLLRLSHSGEELFYLDSREGNSYQLKSFNLKSRQPSVLFRAEGREIVDILWDENTGVPFAVCTEDARRHWHTLSNNQLSSHFFDSEYDLVLIAHAKRARKILARKTSDRHSGDYLVIDLSSSYAQPVGINKPVIDASLLSRTEVHHIRARDGLELLAYMNLSHVPEVPRSAASDFTCARRPLEQGSVGV